MVYVSGSRTIQCMPTENGRKSTGGIGCCAVASAEAAATASAAIRGRQGAMGEAPFESAKEARCRTLCNGASRGVGLRATSRSARRRSTLGAFPEACTTSPPWHPPSPGRRIPRSAPRTLRAQASANFDRSLGKSRPGCHRQA